MHKYITHLLLIFIPYAVFSQVYLGNGVKIGEASQTEVIFWTRTTNAPDMKKDGADFVQLLTDNKKELMKILNNDPKSLKQFPKDKKLQDMNGSIMGANGEVKFTYFPTENKADVKCTEWMPVNSDKNYTLQFKAQNLTPGTSYQLLTECRPTGSKKATQSTSGAFKTAPSQQESRPSTFVVVTCGDYPRRDDKNNGHVIYKTMLELKPDFFVHTGDIEYYDKPDPWAINQELARYKWDRLYGLPYLRNFHNQVSSYFMKDDHDTTMNDASPGQNFGELTWELGLATFREQFPMGEKTYRTVRWGKDLQVWFVEGRDYRSPNKSPDGPQKTIWGKVQKDWFFNSVRNSNATFKILISPTPIVGPDRRNKNDNHANKGFNYEGNEIREFISKQKNMFIVCGDRHWQYHTIHPELKVNEFSCGPSSDNHASGYSEKYQNKYHQYLKVLGGFLSVNTGPEKVTFNHHAPNGKVRYSKSFTAK